MASQSWVSLLDNSTTFQTASGTALSTATTATISPQAAGSKDFTLPANFFYPGLTLRITAQGFLTTTGTSTTLTVLLATSTPTTLATSAGIATGTGTLTGLPWHLKGFITCTALGSSGNTLLTEAVMFLATTTAPAVGTASCTLIGLPNASGTTASAIDTTSAQGICLRATLAGANATIQCTNWDIEALD
jgi:hypothetical protein